MITSRRSNSAWVAAWRSRSISSLRDESFSMYVSRPGQVRLGLVVVEVADEVLDRVVREELAELGVELGGERLVVGEDERRLWLAFSMTLAIVNVLPVPVAPEQRLVAQAALRGRRSAARSPAGWSPVGSKGATSLKSGTIGGYPRVRQDVSGTRDA